MRSVFLLYFSFTYFAIVPRKVDLPVPPGPAITKEKNSPSWDSAGVTSLGLNGTGCLRSIGSIGRRRIECFIYNPTKIDHVPYTGFECEVASVRSLAVQLECCIKYLISIERLTHRLKNSCGLGL